MAETEDLKQIRIMEEHLAKLPKRFSFKRVETLLKWDPRLDGWTIYFGSTVIATFKFERRTLKVHGRKNAEDLKEWFQDYGTLMSFPEVTLDVKRFKSDKVKEE